MLIQWIEIQWAYPHNLGPDGKPWMTWDNYGVLRRVKFNINDVSTWTWHLDHIVPHSLFKYSTMECQEFRDCWALGNLQPLAAHKNLKKSNRLITAEEMYAL